VADVANVSNANGGGAGAVAAGPGKAAKGRPGKKSPATSPPPKADDACSPKALKGLAAGLARQAPQSGKPAVPPPPDLVLVDTFVRADITYLKQDFSVLQPVANHGALWPADQRFDYLARQRPVSKAELQLWQETGPGDRPVSRQQEAILYALRQLTGEDAGPTPADWLRLYSSITGQRRDKPLNAQEQARSVCDLLIAAPAARQAELLWSFKDRASPVYDAALVLAIPRLPTTAQPVARTVLADRMYCLPVKELRDKLRYQNADVLRAALKVCRLRGEKSLVPELIALLKDEDPAVAKKALQSLRELTGQDFGPHGTADGLQRDQAVAAWRDWWGRRSQPLAGKNAEE
jgi:hypothetical protein